LQEPYGDMVTYLSQDYRFFVNS